MVLANKIEKSGTNYEMAFRAYQDKRYLRTGRVQLTARFLARLSTLAVWCWSKRGTRRIGLVGIQIRGRKTHRERLTRINLGPALADPSDRAEDIVQID